MNQKEFTEKQKVRVIYDSKGMYIREEDVYGLMQKYAEHASTIPVVSNRLNEVTLEEINTIMWESYMIKSRTFDREQGAMIMKELEKWAKR